ncbi:MAG: glutamate 5-kinase [Pseudomonadota bacterium]|nr:glutamate 5-kinase [Pseudomonadota bacterium]
MNRSNWKRIVVKVGSALIAPNRQGCSSHYLLSIAQFIVRCRMQGIQVVLVSSGSVAAGAHIFPEETKKNIAIKKAMAAAGQTEMMATWDKLFDFPSAQVLLTHADLRDRERYVSIRETLDSLLDHGVLPIVNENDTVTTDKLKVGDNDNLSAMVAAAADADALVICSDVDGLYDKNPHKHDDAKLLSWVDNIDESIYAMAGGAAEDGVGTGGMRTKVEAAEKAVSHGIDTFIINGFTELSFNLMLEGQNPGTHFQAHEKPMKENVHWMTHTSNAQGEVVIKEAFSDDLDEGVESLTSSEILDVKGEFSVGDTILVRREDGVKLAKAKSNYSSCLLNFIANEGNQKFASEFEEKTGPIISEQHIAVLENK